MSCKLVSRLHRRLALAPTTTLAKRRRPSATTSRRLVISREIKDRGASYALSSLGNAYAGFGPGREGRRLPRAAPLQIARESKDRDDEGYALGNLGNAYADLGQAEKAIGYYEQHLQIARETGDRDGESNALGNLGLAYTNLGQAEKAIGLLEQGWSSHGRQGPPW